MSDTGDLTLPPAAEAAVEPVVAPPLPPPAGPSWLEQDGVLRDMWLANQTPQQISDALNRSVPAIMTRAARLGLPRRSAPGRKPGRRLLGTDQDGQAHIQMHGPGSARGGDMVRRTVRTTTAPLNEPPVTSLRVCLMCLHKFESAGRHNRICSSCKNTAEYETASSLSDIQLTAGG